MLYKVFIRYKTTIEQQTKEFKSPNKFYEYIGKTYLNSVEPIKEIRYKMLKRKGSEYK